ncbi:MAG: hypothetical protein J1E05_08540 [Eubacterium sp.]|nr:hypothetical protein [Eubacterium sp.]
MKKVVVALLLAVFLFAGCQMKTYNPEIGDFQQSAAVTLRDNSYTCDISRVDKLVTVTATSSNAIGLTITYNGDSAMFKYFDLEYEVTSDKIDDTNLAKAIYDAFEVITTAPDKASKTADGFRYDGKTDLGNFTILQYDDFSFKSIEFRDANIKIVFD